MIKLEYVGNRPVITPKGVSFIDSKHDKYNYIEPATHLLEKLINTEDTAVSLLPKSVYDQSKIMEIVYKVVPDFDTYYEQQIEQYKQKLQEEIDQVDDFDTLQEVEKETLRNNYEFMYKFRLQRATNKIVYETIVNECVKLIHDKKITEIAVPFSENFLHLCRSIESTIEIEYRQMRADILTMLDKGNPYSKVLVKYL
ncbi:MAG: hypothetical protein ACQERK_03460 [Campylobacterota bacterium]